MIEKTYCMLKPDALVRGIAGKIIARIEEAGFKINRMMTKTLSESLVDEHYAHVADKPFYPDMRTYLTSGQVVCMELEKENAIADLRTLIGSTREPATGTIRNDFRISESLNTIHASDSPETVEIELKRFFGDFQ